jgi:Fe-S cluster biogenesis protein NfuA
MRTLVEETIEVIRPALQADGGDIVMRDRIDGVTEVVNVVDDEL